MRHKEQLILYMSSDAYKQIMFNITVVSHAKIFAKHKLV